VTIRGKDNADHSIDADGKTTLGDFPLVVLVDEYTASAGEIVAGALKENGRAVVVGTRTYGKGSVQSVIPLKGGGAIRLTTAYFFAPGGRGIDRQAGQAVWGVDPTDGDYVEVSPEQALKRREKLVKGLSLLPDQPGQELTPAWIEKEGGDPQLAAGLTALIAKLTRGEFARVGKDAPNFAAQVAQSAELKKRRAEVMKNLEKLNHELEELNRSASGTK
jgi:hypothetical protein